MKTLRVLLVDDEIMIREGFKRLFDWEAHDCEVVGEAADGMDALTKIDTLQPDIAIMDINIPIMNGLKVIQRSRVNHPDTAFIIVSGYDDFSYCREALRLQITDYILKPVDYEEFGDCIDNLKITLFQRRAAAANQLHAGLLPGGEPSGAQAQPQKGSYAAFDLMVHGCASRLASSCCMVCVSCALTSSPSLTSSWRSS